MTNTYTDPYAYLRAASGHDTSTIIANLTHIGSGGVLSGGTSIPLQTATTTALQAYDSIYIFDGASSEVVTMTPTSTSSGATSLTVSPTQYAHSAGVVICTDGLIGSLASMIFTASSQIEEYCRQPLLQATYSNEKLPLRTMRAAVTRDATLMLRPKRFPVQSVSAATLNLIGQATVSLNTANANIDADAQLVQFMPMSSSGGTMTAWGIFAAPARATTPGYVLLSYTAGYAYAALPLEIRQACIWMTSDLLSDRRNPTGASVLTLGDMTMITPLRNDKAGRSLLIARAENALTPYMQRMM
jgi:hypothetical protein